MYRHLFVVAASMFLVSNRVFAQSAETQTPMERCEILVDKSRNELAKQMGRQHELLEQLAKQREAIKALESKLAKTRLRSSAAKLKAVDNNFTQKFGQPPLQIVPLDRREADGMIAKASESAAGNAAARSSDSSDMELAVEKADKGLTFAVDYRFHRQAYFDVSDPGFESPSRVLVVQEGMRVAITEDGQYEISLILETPDMPVELRMSIQLQMEDKSIRSISIPVVRIPDLPGYDRYDPNKGQRWSFIQSGHFHVRHQGALPGLIGGETGNVKVVSRSGWVRAGFGTIPATVATGL